MSIDPGMMMADPSIPPMVGTTPPVLGSMPDEALQFLADTLPLAEAPKPKRPAPKPAWVLEQKERLKRFWSPRNKRFRRDQELYEQYAAAHEAEEDEDNVGKADTAAGEVIVLNDPFVVLEKLSNMLGSQEPTTSVPPRDPAAKDAAQKTEDALVWWRDEAATRWQQTLHGPLTRDEAHYLGLRGWLCGRIVWAPDDWTFPWDYTLVDAANVYPQIGKRGFEYVVHAYTATVAEVRLDLGYSDELLRGLDKALRKPDSDEPLDADQEVEVCAYYDDEWHLILVNNQPVKKATAHEYGFQSFLIVTANGSPVRATEWDKKNYVARIGLSVFEGMRTAYTKLNRIASMLATEIAKVPNPPVVVYTDAAGQLQKKTIDTSPGANNNLVFEKEKWEIVQTSQQALQVAEPLLQILQDRLNRSTLPPVLWGEGAGTLSGFAVSLLSAGARDVVFPLVRAIEGYRRLLNRRVLSLYEKFGPQLVDEDGAYHPVELVLTQRGGEFGGQRRQGVQYLPEDVTASGIYNEVSYRSLAPQDRAAMAQVAKVLVDSKIIDLETARGDEFIGLQNPGLINERVLAEMVYMDPSVLQLLIPYALQKTNPELYAAYLIGQQQKLAQALAGKGGGTTGGKSEGGGLPPEVAPPALAGEAPPAPAGQGMGGPMAV